jgi:hypothetical protein
VLAATGFDMLGGGYDRIAPLAQVVQLANPILSGWVNYFAIGDSGECFAFIRSR